MPAQLLLLLLAICAPSSSLLLDHSTLNTSRLELVQVLFRNGERAPYKQETYPTNSHKSYEPWTAGQLTDIGRHRARRLGQTLKRQYEGFLPRQADDVYAYSVNYDSCWTSLKMLLDGLYGPRQAARVTIRSVPIEADVLMNSRACSRFKVELDGVRRSSEVEKMLGKYEGLYKYLMEKTGMTFDNMSADQALYDLYELLEAQRNLNLTLPDWCPENVMTLLHEVAFLHYNLESHTDDLKRLNGGPLLRRFLDSMKRIVGRSRLHLYSGEGTNLAGFARALNKKYPRVPAHGSAIILEKRRAEQGRAYVRIMIWTGSSEKLFPLQLKDCPEMCPLEEFVRLVEPSLPGDQDVRCLLDDLGERRKKAAR